MECWVFAKHSIRPDEFIGGMKENLHSLLEKGATEGQFITVFLRKTLLLNLGPPTVTRELCRYDANGTPRKTNIVTKFTMIPHTTLASTTSMQMGEAVAQGNDTFAQMSSAPSSLEPRVSMVTSPQSVTSAWGPFLDKIKVFTEIVDKISEVQYRTDRIFKFLSTCPSLL